MQRLALKRSMRLKSISVILTMASLDWKNVAALHHLCQCFKIWHSYHCGFLFFLSHTRHACQFEGKCATAQHKIMSVLRTADEELLKGLPLKCFFFISWIPLVGLWSMDIQTNRAGDAFKTPGEEFRMSNCVQLPWDRCARDWWLKTTMHLKQVMGELIIL